MFQAVGRPPGSGRGESRRVGLWQWRIKPRIWAGGHQNGEEATLPVGFLVRSEPTWAGGSEAGESQEAWQGTQKIHPLSWSLPGAWEGERDRKVDTQEAGGT